MKISRLLSAGALVTCSFVYAQIGTNSLALPRIHQLHLRHQPAVDVFLTVAAYAKVPMGLVLADNQMCDSKIDLMVDDEPLENVLDTLTGQMPGYAWVTDNGLVRISPKKLPENTKKLLELVIPTFKTSASTLAAQRLALWMNVHAVLKPDEGTAIDMLETPGAPKRGPISLQGATVKEILDVIASQPPIGAWVLFPVPQNFNTAADGQFAAVFTYDDKLGNPNIECTGKSSQP